MHAARVRFVAREVGPATIGVLVCAMAVLWIAARPAGEPGARYVGQLFGAESILLLAIGLVLISTLPWVEQWFDGIDRAAIWHRRVAITGLVLLAPHVLLSSNPNGTALGGPLGAIGAIGMVMLALWAIVPRWRSVVPVALRGIVVAVRDVAVVRDLRRPVGRRVEFVPGQFAMVYLEAKDGWHRHPFTISSAPQEDIVRVTVKALGDYTSRLEEIVEPGMPAVIAGPHGRFTHHKGGDRQVWIAGGVGVAPFLSWLRALDGHLSHRVDFFYSADGAAPFADEIRAIADRHDSLRVHLVDTGVEGRLTPERVLADAGGDPRGLTVFMCGPGPMVRSFQTRLRQGGVPARRIHREQFDRR